MTSSARASNAGGASRPSAFAVLRLMNSSLPTPPHGRQLGLRRLYGPRLSGSAGFSNPTSPSFLAPQRSYLSLEVLLERLPINLASLNKGHLL